MKIILKIVKKIIFSCLLLYTYNLIALPLDIIIPINYITVLLLSVFGVYPLFSLIMINVLVF